MNAGFGDGVGGGAGHFENRRREILGGHDGLALAVQQIPLAADDVVVLQDVLSLVEMLRFNLELGLAESVGQGLVMQRFCRRRVLVLGLELLRPVVSVEGEKVVFQR